MTFRKTKLIDNRPSWHLLRQRVKFSSQGDQILTDNLFQPSKQTWGSFDLVLAKRILRAEDKSDRVFSSCRRKMKEGQEKELMATGVQLKRTKSRKTLFSSSGTDKYKSNI